MNITLSNLVLILTKGGVKKKREEVYIRRCEKSKYVCLLLKDIWTIFFFRFHL